MLRFRLSIFTTIAWLFFVLNLEAALHRFEIAVHIQPFVYVMAISIVVGMMLFLKLHHVQDIISVSTLVLLYAIAKVLFPTHLSVEGFMTAVVVEISLIVGTFYATKPVARWFANYSMGLKQAVFSPTNTLLKDNYNNTATIERKINLARRFERQLSLLYIPMHTSLHNSNDIKRMALQRQVNELVNFLIAGCGVHAWHNGDLMMCIQGEAVAHVETIAEQFSTLIADVMKVQIQVGVATFPTQGLMLDDLIEVANMSLNSSMNQSPAPVVELFPKPIGTARTGIA